MEYAVLYAPAGGAVMQCFECFAFRNIAVSQPMMPTIFCFIYSKVEKFVRLLVKKVMHLAKNQINLFLQCDYKTFIISL